MTTNPFDPILDLKDNESDRFVLGEIENMEAYVMYKKATAAFWVAESIDLGADALAFRKLRPDEKSFLLKILAFFSGSDGIVLENVVTRFYGEVKQAEVRLFYGLQIAIENIHSEVYTDLIRTFETDLVKREQLFQGIENCVAVRKKAEWAEEWLNSDRPFSERLIAFAAVEGILFSASFCAIFYFKKRGELMPGLYQSNEYISRDEALHCQFAVMLFHQLREHNKCSEDKIREIVKSAVEVERGFVNDALAKPILGMNKSMMMQYVQFVADGLLKMLKCRPLYKSKNPFAFMNQISMDNKANFFERRVTEYNLAEISIPSEKAKNDERKLSFEQDDF